MGAFKRPAVYDGGLQRPSRVGDIVLNNLSAANLSADAATLITASDLSGGLIIRTGPTAGRTDTLPTAALILAAFSDMDISDSFTIIYANQSTQTVTLATGSGITLTGDTTVETLTHKLLLFTKLSATTMRCDIL